MLHPREPPAALAPRQQRFVDLYVTTGNASRAAREAGYPERSAHVAGNRLLKNAKVAAAIQKLQAEAAARAMLDRQRIVREIEGAIEIARLRGDPSAMIAGWREIARMLGFYTPEVHRIEVSPDGARLAQRLGAMSDAELLRLVESDEG